MKLVGLLKVILNKFLDIFIGHSVLSALDEKSDSKIRISQLRKDLNKRKSVPTRCNIYKNTQSLEKME